MGRLGDVSVEALREQLKETEKKIPAQRLLAAIGRKQGDTIAELADRHGVTEKTIQNWLERFEERPIERAPYDEKRSGRPPKLTDEERDEFLADLHMSPRRFGYDSATWSPKIATEHLKDKYGVDYSTRHVRRMIKRAATETEDGFNYEKEG
ncbi:MAG: helix-turn-helix domain-containing protein [Halodesulfurarchaeum sp.]